MEMKDPESPASEFFYGWVIAGLVFLNLAIAYGAQYSFGVFFPSLLEEFQWDRKSISGAFALYTFMYTILGALLGRWTDRFGPRVVLLYGSAFLGGGIALISQVREPWHLYVFYGLLASWGMSATYITSNPTVVKWFIQKRGLAIGLAQSGLGVGIILIPPLTGAMITGFGWRSACIVLGGIVSVVLFTTAFFLVGHPEKIGLLPDGRRMQSPGRSHSPGHPIVPGEVVYSASEAIHTSSFWVLTAIFFLTWLFVFLPLVHLVIFTLDLGLSKRSAFLALSVLGGFSTAGRLVMGFISDRIGRKPALGLNIGLQFFSWLWIMGTDRSWMLVLFAAAFGFSYGGISAVFPAITGDYFGRLKAASVIGALFTISGTSAAVGPILAGYIYDLTRSYQLAFLLGALSNLLAFILVFIAKPPAKTTRSSPHPSPPGRGRGEGEGAARRSHFFRTQSRKKPSPLKIKLCAKGQQNFRNPPRPPF
jgi:MFS family permease